MPISCTIFVGIFSVLAILCLCQHFLEKRRSLYSRLRKLDVKYGNGHVTNGFVTKDRTESESTCLCQLSDDSTIKKKKRKNKRSKHYSAII